MRPVHLAIAIAAFATTAAQGQSQGQSQGRSQGLVFLVRHAEKAAQPANDPPLTSEGEIRARALAEVLATAGITAIISTPYARTLATVKPLAERLGVAVEIVAISAGSASNPLSPPEVLARHAQAVADVVRKHADEAVLVVGHSNTIAGIAAALGAPKLPDLCDGDYDQIFVLELRPSGPPRFMRSRFGVPATDPKCASMR